MYMKTLEKAGYLERVGNPKYPCIGLSFKGEDALYNSEEIILDFPEPTIKKPKKAKKKEENIETSFRAIERLLNDETESAFDDDLLARLKAVRKEIAAARNVELWKVLPNVTLEELAEKAPVTSAEALKIKGIGPAKIRTVVPRFLDEIQSWREELE